MRENKIKAHYIKPYTVTTKDCDFSSKLENILDGYLNSIMDLYSRKIIAWTLSRTLEVLECIKTAKRIRKTANPVIIQSDRGVHYTSNRYKKLTAGLICSYSRKSNPWDNACIESYHSLIKREWLNRFEIMDYNHAYNLIFEYLEGFYNTVRIQKNIVFSILYIDPSLSSKYNFIKKYISYLFRYQQ